MALALAAYSRDYGTFPDSLGSLESAGYVRVRGTSVITVLVYEDIPPFIQLGPPDLQIDLNDIRVQWNGPGGGKRESLAIEWVGSQHPYLNQVGVQLSNQLWEHLRACSK
jgi:hypothetical protein